MEVVPRSKGETWMLVYVDLGGGESPDNLLSYRCPLGPNSFSRETQGRGRQGPGVDGTLEEEGEG